jgi:hypothetical protein
MVKYRKDIDNKTILLNTTFIRRLYAGNSRASSMILNLPQPLCARIGAKRHDKINVNLIVYNGHEGVFITRREDNSPATPTIAPAPAPAPTATPTATPDPAPRATATPDPDPAILDPASNGPLNPQKSP